jgi:predicted nuclease of predicted toxin-antitoxin system
MSFKVDENIHADVSHWLRSQGHDAASVREQGHCSCSDDGLAAVCQRENRVLITQDLDFSNTVAFPPEDYPGIVVLRLADQSKRSCLAALERMLAKGPPGPMSRSLWIVDESRIRIRTGTIEGE